ncbi:MAG: ribosomal-processing cysteine protease Prp [Oscillospiraceae bacterium]
MINTEFFLKDEVIIGFSISGHAGYDIYGKDVACASVSSAVQLTSNAITEILGISADVSVAPNRVMLMLPKNNGSLSYEKALDFLKALKLHIELLADDYKQNIRLTDVEV